MILGFPAEESKVEMEIIENYCMQESLQGSLSNLVQAKDRKNTAVSKVKRRVIKESPSGK